ncbi:MAG: hypothetical protein ACXVCY_05985 [Pseudobdellovibrionaceae bacterium]
MKRLFITIKEHALKLHNIIKEIDQIPFRVFRDELYDEGDTKLDRPAPRKNKVKVEDLRPQRPAEKTDK